MHSRLIIVYFFVLVCFQACQSDETEGINLVQNGDFETGAHWTPGSPNPCAAAADDTASPAGSKVLEINMDLESEANINAESLQYISQDKFVPGKTYEMVFWAKADLPLNGEVEISLIDPTWTVTLSTTMMLTASSNKEWTKYREEFIAPTLTSPALLLIRAYPYTPFTGTETYRVLLDGFEIHRK